jgi:hypothetical protein
MSIAVAEAATVPCSRFEDDLGPAVVACVEVPVRVRCLGQGQLVTDEERRLRPVRRDLAR